MWQTHRCVFWMGRLFDDSHCLIYSFQLFCWSCMCSFTRRSKFPMKSVIKKYYSTSCFFFLLTVTCKKGFELRFYCECFFFLHSIHVLHIVFISWNCSQIVLSVCVHWLFNLVTDSLESHKHFFLPHSVSLCSCSTPFLCRCQFATHKTTARSIRYD